MRASLVKSGGVALLLGFFGACVPEHAGYGDVKKLTAARLDSQVSWNAADGTPRKEVAELLRSPMTADLAGQIAVLNSPRLQAEFETLGVARAAWVSALQLPNPTVGAAAIYGIDDSPELDFDAAISVTGLLLLPSRSGIASSQLQAAAQDVTNSVLGIAFDAKRAFVEYQIAHAELELRKTITQAWYASSEMAKRLFEMGNIPELRTVNERAFYEEMRVQQANAEARVHASREQLNAALGLWGRAGAEWSLGPNPLPVPRSVDDTGELLKDVESRAIQRSLALNAARQRYEAFARRANLTRFAGWVPEVHAGVRLAREKDDGEAARWGAGPLVELDLPLFYQGQGETGAALAEMRRQGNLLDDIAVRTRSASRAVQARLTVAAQTAAHYRDVILPLRGQVVEETQLQYNAMSVGVFELLQAKNMEITAHLAYLDVLREYWTMELDLAQLLAGGLRDPGNTPRLPSGASGVSGASAGAGH